MLKLITRTISKKVKFEKLLKTKKNIPNLKKEDKPENSRDLYRRAENTFIYTATTYEFFMAKEKQTLNISSHMYKGTELKIIGTHNLAFNSSMDLVEYFEETKPTNFIINLQFGDLQLGKLKR